MSGISGSFATYRADTNDPRRGADGLAWAAAVGGAQDAEMVLLRQAALCRIPATCPDDGLDELGQAFVLPRYPNESNDTYRARLVAAWSTYKLAGSAAAIVASLQAYGLGDVFCLPVYQSPAPFPPESSSTSYSLFYLFLGPSFGSSGIAPLVLGSWTLGSATSVLGSTMTSDQLTAIREQVLRWKSAHSYPIKIVLQLTGTAGSPTTATAAPTYPIGRTLGDTWGPLGSDLLGGFNR